MESPEIDVDRVSICALTLFEGFWEADVELPVPPYEWRLWVESVSSTLDSIVQY